ncbi:MAG: NYN domain-containing protein [Minisyncoccales bacterium]
MQHKTKKNNFAYIDGNNLYRGIKKSGWTIDLIRFRKWLYDKYGVVRAYYFIGLVPEEKELHSFLQKAGFILIFKEVAYTADGEIKGNCDADLVLEAVRDVYENKCDKQILVASDGDYSSLIKFLISKDKLKIILSPSVEKKCSILLKKIGAPITYLKEVREMLELKRKNPR